MWKLVSSPTINSRTTGYITVSHNCIIYVRSDANWKLETPTEPTRDTLSGAGSGLCELTNQGYSGGGALKRQELKETKTPAWLSSNDIHTHQATLSSGYWNEVGVACRLWAAAGRRRERAVAMQECAVIVLPYSLVAAEGRSHPSPAAPSRHLWLTSYQLSFYNLLHMSTRRWTCTDIRCVRARTYTICTALSC